MPTRVRPCEICRREIEPERIEALPDTRLCAEHAKMIAKHGGEFTITYTRERLGKPGSLKKNYGGVTPHKLRNRTAMAKLRQEHAERARPERDDSDS